MRRETAGFRHSISIQSTLLRFISKSLLNPALPALVDLIVARALAKSPDARYQNAADMAADLRTCRLQCASVADFRLPARVRSMPGSSGAVTDASTTPGAATVSRGLARDFDSTEATIRLAARSAAIDDPDRLAATVGVSREVVEAGDCESLLDAPQHPYTQQLLAAAS